MMKERKWEQFGTEEAMEKAFELFARDNQKGYQDTLILLRDHINNDMVVQYPGYQFFSKNRGPVKFPKYQYVLPHPSDSDLSLPLRPNN